MLMNAEEHYMGACFRGMLQWNEIPVGYRHHSGGHWLKPEISGGLRHHSGGHWLAPEIPGGQGHHLHQKDVSGQSHVPGTAFAMSGMRMGPQNNIM
jgi:hypothetical protein